VSSQQSKGQSKGELKTARTLNTVAIIGATHPMFTATRNLASQAPEGVKAAAGKLVPKRAVAAVRGGVERVATRNPGAKAAAKFAAKHGKVAGAAAATGWLGFHGAELAGDVLGRRSINAQLNQKEQDMSKALSVEQSFVSKAETDPVTGHGTSIEKRYYDSEADRQRRIGMATGLLGGTSIVTGAAAANGVKAERGLSEAAGGARRAGVQASYLIPKGANAKKVLGRKAGLAAVAAASGIGAVASYKRGISRRNQTWQ